MRVAVNLLWLRPGLVGGSEEYLTRMLGAFDDPDVELTLFTQRAFAAAHPELAERHRTHRLAGVLGHQALRVTAEHSWLAAHERRFDVVHHAGSTAPFTTRVTARRHVVTFHDLQFLTFPEFFRRPRRAYLRAVTPPAARHATVVTVPSAYVRDRVREVFGVPDDRVVVVPHGLDPALGRRATTEPDVRARYRLPGPYVVYPAITHPHKNHVTLLEAMAVLRASRPDLRLVLTGGVGHAEPGVRAAIDRLGLGSVVVRTGRVPPDDRDGLLGHAAALAFPSRYEGFGAPVLEAMRLGCPVVAASSTALPEVVGDAGVLVDPLDPEAWASALADLVEGGPAADALRAAGRARAASYTAARSAAALAGAYRRAVA